MEAKVDVRKLQLLNDRIAQTIEALNQVRLSVHGLAHTPGLPPTTPFLSPTIPFPGYGLMPNFPGTFPTYPGIFPGVGLQHSPFTPFAPFTPYTLPHVPGIAPLPFMSGLSHTPPDIVEQKMIEFRAMDPYRIYQTFPYINTALYPTPTW